MIPQNVYDTILSYWSYVKTIKQRDDLHTHWYMLNEVCEFDENHYRVKIFKKSWNALLPKWYDEFDKRMEINYDIQNTLKYCINLNITCHDQSRIICRPMLDSILAAM